MLDVKFIRENLDLVEKSTKEKGYKINVKESSAFFLTSFGNFGTSSKNCKYRNLFWTAICWLQLKISAIVSAEY